MNVTLSGDTMMLVELEQTIDPSVNQQVIALAQRLDKRLGRLVRDIVPSYCAIGIHFDPLATDLAALERIVQEEWRHVDRDHMPSPGPPLDIEVRYGGDDGPDLEAVAQWAGCSPASVIERHSSRTYRVYMLGFVPGFCYMGRVDRRIAAPRRSVPRDRVPGGSVGIAGEQTGVYPITSPGGWQLIGRTSAVMFDPGRADPTLLHPGDLVRFKPV
jgi:inhibitor of KinA